MGIFAKRKWSKWKHVRFITKHDGGYGRVYNLMVKECELTGVVRYRRVFVSNGVQHLEATLMGKF